jgi:uncharacterized damage-inducible protein DinB
MTPGEIRTLFDYNAWANHRSLEAAAALPNEQFTKALVSSFPSVRDTLAHICGAEWIWHQRFQDISPSALPDLSSLTTAEALRAHWSAQESKLLEFVAQITQADLDRVIEFKTLNFGVYRSSLLHCMQHLVNHGTYHRGQITTLLRQLGRKPILTDLMHFYRERSAVAGG